MAERLANRFTGCQSGNPELIKDPITWVTALSCSSRTTMTTAPRHRPAQSIASSVPTKTQSQSLARRLLLPPHSSDDLPPLLARSPNAHPELTTELYDFIALALRAYVNPWWTKLTRYDKEFLPHINRILLHVIHILEDRIHNIPLESLVFHDLPTLVTQHYTDFRNAQSKLATSYATGGAASLSQLFAQIQPHMAISSDGTIDPEYYRQTVDLILKACLPPEDYEPEVERVIIREVLVKVIVGAIIPKVTQPWFIQKAILDLIGPIDDEPYPVSSSKALGFLELTRNLAGSSVLPVNLQRYLILPECDHHNTLSTTILFGCLPCPHTLVQASNQYHQAC